MLLDPNSFKLRGELTHGKDVEIDMNVILKGKVRLGNRVKIGAGCVLTNCDIGDDVEIKPYSVLEDTSVGANAAIGPFSRLRPAQNWRKTRMWATLWKSKKRKSAKAPK